MNRKIKKLLFDSEVINYTTKYAINGDVKLFLKPKILRPGKIFISIIDVKFSYFTFEILFDIQLSILNRKRLNELKDTFDNDSYWRNSKDVDKYQILLYLENKDDPGKKLIFDKCKPHLGAAFEKLNRNIQNKDLIKKYTLFIL